jgi:hypothetical protein
MGNEIQDSRMMSDLADFRTRHSVAVEEDHLRVLDGYKSHSVWALLRRNPTRKESRRRAGTSTSSRRTVAPWSVVNSYFQS